MAPKRKTPPGKDRGSGSSAKLALTDYMLAAQAVHKQAADTTRESFTRSYHPTWDPYTPPDLRRDLDPSQLRALRFYRYGLTNASTEYPGLVKPRVGSRRFPAGWEAYYPFARDRPNDAANATAQARAFVKARRHHKGLYSRSPETWKRASRGFESTWKKGRGKTVSRGKASDGLYYGQQNGKSKLNKFVENEVATFQKNKRIVDGEIYEDATSDYDSDEVYYEGADDSYWQNYNKPQSRPSDRRSTVSSEYVADEEATPRSVHFDEANEPRRHERLPPGPNGSTKKVPATSATTTTKSNTQPTVFPPHPHNKYNRHSKLSIPRSPPILSQAERAARRKWAARLSEDDYARAVADGMIIPLAPPTVTVKSSSRAKWETSNSSDQPRQNDVGDEAMDESGDVEMGDNNTNEENSDSNRNWSEGPSDSDSLEGLGRELAEVNIRQPAAPQVLRGLRLPRDWTPVWRNVDGEDRWLFYDQAAGVHRPNLPDPPLEMGSIDPNRVYDIFDRDMLPYPMPMPTPPWHLDCLSAEPHVARGYQAVRDDAGLWYYIQPNGDTLWHAPPGIPAFPDLDRTHFYAHDGLLHPVNESSRSVAPEHAPLLHDNERFGAPDEGTREDPLGDEDDDLIVTEADLARLDAQERDADGRDATGEDEDLLPEHEEGYGGSDPTIMEEDEGEYSQPRSSLSLPSYEAYEPGGRLAEQGDQEDQGAGYQPHENLRRRSDSLRPTLGQPIVPPMAPMGGLPYARDKFVPPVPQMARFGEVPFPRNGFVPQIPDFGGLALPRNDLIAPTLDFDGLPLPRGGFVPPVPPPHVTGSATDGTRNPPSRNWRHEESVTISPGGTVSDPRITSSLPYFPNSPQYHPISVSSESDDYDAQQEAQDRTWETNQAPDGRSNLINNVGELGNEVAKQLTEATRRILELEESARGHEQTIQELLDENDTGHDALLEAQDDALIAQNEAARLQTLLEARDGIANTTTQDTSQQEQNLLQQANDKIKALQKELEDCHKHGEQLQAHMDQMEKELDDCHEDGNKFKDQAESAALKLHDCEAVNQRLHQQVADLENRLKSCEQDRNGEEFLQNQITELKERLQSARGDGDLATQLEQCERARDDARKDLHDMYGEIPNLRLKLKDALAKSAEGSTECQEKLQAAEKRIAQLETELKDAEDTTAELLGAADEESRSGSNDCCKHCMDAKVQNEHLQDKIAELENDLEAAIQNQPADDDLRAAQALIAKLKKLARDKTDEALDLQKSLDECYRHGRRLQNKLNATEKAPAAPEKSSEKVVKLVPVISRSEGAKAKAALRAQDVAPQPPNHERRMVRGSDGKWTRSTTGTPPVAAVEPVAEEMEEEEEGDDHDTLMNDINSSDGDYYDEASSAGPSRARIFGIPGPDTDNNDSNNDNPHDFDLAEDQHFSSPPFHSPTDILKTLRRLREANRRLTRNLSNVRETNKRLMERIRTEEVRKHTIVESSAREYGERVQLRKDFDALVERNAVLQRCRDALLRQLREETERLRGRGREGLSIFGGGDGFLDQGEEGRRMKRKRSEVF